MRPARGFVLFGQVLGEIEIDGQEATPRFDEKPALPQPPDGESPRVPASSVLISSTSSAPWRSGSIIL